MGDTGHASRLEVGTVVADTYEVVRLLGRGGMGAVWEARHVRLPGKKVAIKVLHPDAAQSSEVLARFRREAKIASRLGHPNIVEVHDFNELPSGAPYLVLEYLEGESLAQRLRRGPMPLAPTTSLLRQIGSALRAAHRAQVIHRDLKPQNIFLARVDDESPEVVKVLDFGISKIRGSNTVETRASSTLGTPQYMAPEQATGDHTVVDARTDVFALGIMVYEMLSGRPAFRAETVPEVMYKIVYEQPTPLAELCPTLPPRVTGAVSRALSKSQKDRFPSVASFVAAVSGAPLSTAEDAADDPPALATIGPGESSGGSPREGDPASTVPTVASRPAPRGRAPRKKSTAKETRGGAVRARAIVAGLAVVLGTGGLGAAVAIHYFTGSRRAPARAAAETAPARSSPRTPPAAEERVAHAAKPAVADAGPRAAATGDAHAGATGPGAGISEPRGERNPQEASRPPPQSSESTERAARKLLPEVRRDLDRAEQSLAKGDAREALYLARRALHTEKSTRAYSIRTKAYCMEQNLSDARANYINLRGAARRRAARFCARYHIELH